MTSARDYLDIHSEFNLGALVTEAQNPLTMGLAGLARKDLAGAFDLFKEVDHRALALFNAPSVELREWFETALAHLARGGRIFLGGCGATGRLSLGLEFLFKKLCERGEIPFQAEQVISFMAGGDVALIASIEKFEDFASYGARQLEELGFSESDLFVGITEGGETPWVIGATSFAASKSAFAPYFFYCNPDEILRTLTERTRRILSDEGIKKVNLCCGPMALSGSTRLQASTVLMIGVGMPILVGDEKGREKWWQGFKANFKATDYKKLSALTRAEANIYERDEYTYYETDPDYGLTVLTDTTERSPTFSLSSFENQSEEAGPLSWTYLAIKSEHEGLRAWEELLARAPRALEWEETAARTGLSRLEGFYVGPDAKRARFERLGAKLHPITLAKNGTKLELQVERQSFEFEGGGDLFAEAMLLKMLLNAHSTLMMGLLGRFESNIMTYVRPSNNKLVDRMARYVLALLAEEGIKAEFAEVIEVYFEMRTKLGEVRGGRERPVVLLLVAEMQRRRGLTPIDLDTYF